MDPDEIVITLKNLTTAGFTKIESGLTSVESKANATNMSGFSKSTKTVEKDAESAAGKTGGGGILGMVGALTGIPGPAGLAVAAVVGVSAVLFAAGKTSEKVAAQEGLLDAAFKAHGDSLDKEKPAVDAMIKSNEAWGQNADDTRGAITELAQAGQSMSDIEKSMPAITDLAVAKHEDLATASKQVELAEMGNAKALKELGIILPKTAISTKDEATAAEALTKAQFDVQKANDVVVTAAEKLKLAQESLATTETKLGGKHKMTAADAITLQKAHDAVTTASDNLAAAHLKVGDAEDKVQKAQDTLTLVQNGGTDASVRQSLVLGALTKQLGNQQSAVTPMQVLTAKLNDTWEHFSMKIGPQVMGAITSLMTNAVIPLIDDISTGIDYLSQMWGWLEKTGVISTFGTLFNTFIVTPFKLGFTAVQDLVGLLQQLWQKIQDVGKAIQNSPIGSLGGVVKGAAGAVSGLTGLIPHFAGGGIVAGSGATPIIAHGGEGVFTPDQMAALGGGGGGNHFHVHFDSLVTPTSQQMRDVAHALEPEFARMLALRSTAALNGGI